jgi:hypothetical protein
MADEITLKDVLDHMSAMEQRLSGEMKAVDKRLSGQISSVEANLGRQIDAIDQRLDSIEIEKLPSRVRLLESQV